MKTRIAFLCFVLAFCALASADPRTIEIVAQKSHYTPAEIHVKKGEPVRLLIKSADVTHGFAIDEFNIAREVPVGPAVVVEFTPDKTGSFTYYCVVRCSREHKGMHGTFVVD